MSRIEFVWTPEMDLWFISGDFFEQPIPREKEYLLKYFESRLQRQFVRYFLLFRSPRNFTDHTGLRVLPLWLRKLRKKMNILETAHAKAKADFDLELVAKIETGVYKVCHSSRSKTGAKSKTSPVHKPV
jgi:hypothetical protein